MKTISNAMSNEIIKWLCEYKNKLPPGTIHTREKTRQIDRAIQKLKTNNRTTCTTKYH